jgi:uncharacterized protein (TIGR02001 family)
MASRAILAVLRVAMQASLAIALLLPAWAGELGVTVDVASDYVEHGLTRSQGKPVVRGLASWSFGDGWAFGAGAGTLNLNPGRGASREFSLYLAKRTALARDWSLHTEISHYNFGADTARFSYDYSEFSVALSYRELLSMSVGYSPDYSLFSRGVRALERTAINSAIAAQYPALPWLTLTTGVGHYDLTDLFGKGFWYWSTAAQIDRGRSSFAVSFIDTDGTADFMFGPRLAGRRVVVSLAMRLQ